MKVLSKKTKRKEPCYFLEKLFKILKNKKNNNIIHWDNDGTKVIINNPVIFSKTILPEYFKHENYSSFIRQLNIYGFHKINNIYKTEVEQYTNENFKKNKSLEEIRSIRRKNIVYEDEENTESKKTINKQIKKHMSVLDQINNKDNDETKIDEYKKIIQNGNMNIMSNAYILQFLIGKHKETIDFKNKIQKEITEIKNKNKAVLENIQNKKDCIPEKKDDNDENIILNLSNNLDNNNINNIKSNKNYVIARMESFSLNENLKLLKIFQNDDNKIPKMDDNKNKLNASFCEDLSVLVGYTKNNIEPKNVTSFFVLNNSGILNEPSMINNDNTLLKNMTNSFI